MKHNIGHRITSLCMAAALTLGIGNAMPKDSLTAPHTAHAATIDIQDFGLNDVTMLDSYSTNAFSLELAYLLSFDTNRLLAGFRENAKLSTNGAQRYGGWENTLIAGHTVGHYLTALHRHMKIQV